MKHLDADAILNAVVASVAAELPPDVTPATWTGFVRRHRPQLRAMIEARLARSRARRSWKPDVRPPDEWTAARRTKANLAAMQVAASKPLHRLTPADQRALARYSGWGGLSIRGARDAFPTGFPKPDASALIHEYYTPTKVTDAVAAMVRPLLPHLAGPDGLVHALEPSAGIGRFIQSLSGPGFESIRWQVVELSELSARMLQAMRPDLEVRTEPFERWVQANESEWSGRLGLVVANPPYGPRGASITLDPVRRYRDKRAYVYFVRRALDLLAPRGLGVFITPAGLLTGRSKRGKKLRDTLLRSHHLSAAYRLPSGLFPGAKLVTDLSVWRSRRGVLDEVLSDDRPLVEGEYFQQFPAHILGTEVGRDEGGDDRTKAPRWGYEVRGEFTGLPELVERPFVEHPDIQPLARPPRPKPARDGGLARTVKAAPSELPAPLDHAVALGLRVDNYLSTLSQGDNGKAAGLWPELHAALRAWTDTHGKPRGKRKLARLAKQGVTGAVRFLAAFTLSGELIDGLQRRPEHRQRFRGRASDLPGLALHLYRQERGLTAKRLLEAHREAGGRGRSADALVKALPAKDWAVDGDELVPMDVFLTGELWPRYDRARQRGQLGDERAAALARRLLTTIAPVVFEDIDGLSPQHGWVPLELVSEWMRQTLNRGSGPELTRSEGLVVPVGVRYDDLRDARHLSAQARWFIGWLNHDRTVFRPKRRQDQNLDDLRLHWAKQWETSFRSWVASTPDRRRKVEQAYNRRWRGYVAPTFSTEPLDIGRWDTDRVRLHDYQNAAAHRLVAHRGGLLSFDVGLGKTYTGLAALARARQEGWARRPVIVVPNSLIWKWEQDIRTVLPDYRVGVVGSKRIEVRRGDQKGRQSSRTDTPEERADTWTRFQAGEFDVVLLTYTALGRTRLENRAVVRYAEQIAAIRRQVRLRQRNARSREAELTERQAAVLREGVAAWVAETLEVPESWRYDPQIVWDDLGIDWLMVDEAQNFKNLYMPEPREHGVPRFMGNAGKGANRAWQLDLRCAMVRARTGGAGVTLLSATPAKNSPLELYNLIQFVDPQAWTRLGITDPEQFIDRFFQLEVQHVLGADMKVVEKSAVVGFKNLHELRDVLFRYGEFLTAQDVGLPLPKPSTKLVQVDMNADQERKYTATVKQIEQAVDSNSRRDKGQILGLLARLSLVAIHPRLDEGPTWASAAKGDPHSPKLDAMAKRVLRNRACGHLIFVENIAVHRWVKRVLVAAGVPEERIGVLNGVTAKAVAQRQRIASLFNGDLEAGVPPSYDVLVCNSIAYEGIDLQTRTCAIHHLDLPWEPATLRQRNGRAVRQGNRLEAVQIYYYFARRSLDGLRFDLIRGKSGWMDQLFASEHRQTDNPAAQLDLGPEQILLLISRDPDETRKRLAVAKAKQEARARVKVREGAVRLFRSTNALFRRAERHADPAEAKRLRLEAEERLEDLQATDPAAWPWSKWADRLRTQSVLAVGDAGVPVWEELRVALTRGDDPKPLEILEFGRVRGSSIATRHFGQVSWTERTDEWIAQLGLQPSQYEPELPDGESEAIAAGIESSRASLRFSAWSALGWERASDRWRVETWTVHGQSLLRAMADARSWVARGHRVPALHRGAVRVVGGPELRGAKVLPPTDAGWRRFLQAAPKSDMRFRELAEVGTYWWGRNIPRSLLAGGAA